MIKETFTDDLTYKKIKGIPLCLCSICLPKTLELSANDIQVIFQWLVFSRSLLRLHASYERIRDVPRDIDMQDYQMMPSKVSYPYSDWEKCHMCTIDRFMNSLNLSNGSNSGKPSAGSDYGTCTCSGSVQGKPKDAIVIGCSDSSSCFGDYDSDSLPSVGSDIRSPNHDDMSTLKIAGTDSDEDDSYFERFGKTLPDHSRLLKYKNVTAIIPSHNIEGYTPEEFTLDVVEDLYYTPSLTERTTMHASQVVSLGPHGAKFYEDEPALIYLPLGAHVEDPERIVCLSSDTREGDIPDWKAMPKANYHYIATDNRVMIRAWHFSLYTVVVSCPYPEVTKAISFDESTTLEVSDVQGVRVYFPKDSLTYNFEARIKVFYADDPVMHEYDDVCKTDENALASPIVLLEPHGITFNKDVYVQLPLPDFDLIVKQFGVDPKTSITIYHSPTSEDEPPLWQASSVSYEILQETDGSYVIQFPVRHFSWYKAVWGLLTSTVHGAKVGVSYFYPYIRFSMMCTAMMDETADTRSFGLEIICYRSDKKLPEVGNYRHKVGGSTKPKFVRPGPILIRLVSQDFEADVLHGEDSSLCKEETDFHGMEFEKQFACIYKGEPVKKGVFGKCLVERKSSGVNENIFEFNLTKYGNEGEFQFDSTDGWSAMATRELATMLNITTDENWKLFAKRLGFTKHEINSKLCTTNDPFSMLMGVFKTRGGTPDEFVQTMYSVSRELRGNDTSTDGIGFSKSPSAGFRTGSEDESDTSPGPSNSSTPTRKKRQFTEYTGMAGVFNMGPSKSKKQRSDRSESIASSYSSPYDDQLHRINRQPLESSDLWKISQFINTQWKSLGRNLSVPEEDLNQIEHAYKDMRECAYQTLLKWKERFPQKCFYGTLYVALCDSGLNAVATAHCISTRPLK